MLEIQRREAGRRARADVDEVSTPKRLRLSTPDAKPGCHETLARTVRSGATVSGVARGAGRAPAKGDRMMVLAFRDLDPASSVEALVRDIARAVGTEESSVIVKSLRIFSSLGTRLGIFQAPNFNTVRDGQWIDPGGLGGLPGPAPSHN